MTTVLAPPPPPPDLSRGGRTASRTANRAVARWSRRLLRREWRQQLLVLTLLTVAVAATTIGLGLVVNIQSSVQASMGSAASRVDVSTSGPGTAGEITNAVRQQVPDAEVIEDATIPIPGSATGVDLMSIAQHGRYSSSMLGVVSGHYPGADEIAVTRSLLSTFSLHLGQTWTVLGRARRIVGIVENPMDFSQRFALVAPGQIAKPITVSFLTNADPDVVSNLHLRGGQVVGVTSVGQSLASRKQSQELAVLLIATIGLAFIGLLAVAGFTVMAQRRLRSLGMIGAIGATDRQVRKVMLANGTAVGLVGATVGTVSGLAVWFVLKPAFEKLVGHSIDSLALPWLEVFLGAGLAVVASIAASWWPARTVARMPVVVALTGRPPAPQPAHRFALLGSGLAALGFVLLVLSDKSKTILIVTGIIATTGGMLLLAPLGVQALAGLAGRAPVAMRLALRDLARYQARSGAALAAASLAVGISATIAITAAAQQAHDRSFVEGNLPNNQLIVWIAGGAGGPPGGPTSQSVAAPSGSGGPTSAQIAAGRSVAASIAKSLDVTAIELDVLHNPLARAASQAGPGVAVIAQRITHNGQRGFNFVDQPYVATPALLSLYRIAAGDIHAPIITSRTDFHGAKLFDGARDQLDTIAIQVLSELPKYTSAPDTLVTPKEASALGLTTQAAGFIMQSAHPLTSAQIHAAQTAAASAGTTVETRNASNTSLQQLRDWATFIGVLVALAVLAMTVGLIRSETSGDLRTLTAAGASGRTRRMLTATTAAALALLGGIIGTAGAYVALIAWHWHDVSYLNEPPYLELGALVIALPLVAFVGGWAFGRTPSHLARIGT